MYYDNICRKCFFSPEVAQNREAIVVKKEEEKEVGTAQSREAVVVKKEGEKGVGTAQDREAVVVRKGEGREVVTSEVLSAGMIEGSGTAAVKGNVLEAEAGKRSLTTGCSDVSLYMYCSAMKKEKIGLLNVDGVVRSPRRRRPKKRNLLKKRRKRRRNRLIS